MSLSGLVTGDQLDAETLSPLVWSVPGIVPEGLGILAAPPKAGKSWLVLAIGLAVADGGEVLGVPVDQRPVLYLALEDGWRRLQSRCRQLLGDRAIPGGMTFWIEPDGALQQAEQFVDAHVGANPLVILDTLVTVKPQRRARDEAYTADYGFTRKLKALATPGSTVLLVHHTRKAEAVDFLDAISGTQGIAGAADFVMVLDRERGDRTATLQVTGREVPEARYALLFHDGTWRADGNDLQEAAQRANDRQLGYTKRLVLQFVNSRPATKAADVVENLHITSESARQTLTRLAQEGRIKRLSPGVYVPVTQSQPIEKATSGHIAGRDNALSDCHTVTAPEDSATTQPGLSQPMSQSVSPRSQGEHTDRDTVTRNLESLRSWQSLPQPETMFSDIPHVRQDLTSSYLGPPKELPSAKACEVPGCEQAYFGSNYYGGMRRCFEHAEEWIAEQEMH